jgi:hypothetical protein
MASPCMFHQHLIADRLHFNLWFELKLHLHAKTKRVRNNADKEDGSPKVEATA